MIRNSPLRRSKRLWLGLFILITLLFLAYIFVWPDVCFERAKASYPPGTPAQVILKKYPGKYKLRRTGVVYPGEISEDDKRRGFFYSLYLPEEWAYISFNYYEEVTKVQKAWGGILGKIIVKRDEWAAFQNNE